jgi:branched-subunit amino acid transport protein AzlD
MELISALFVIVVHKWRHNLLLSIVGGTVLYMLLVQRLLSF